MEFTNDLVNKAIVFKFLLSLPTKLNFFMDLNLEKVIPTKVLERKKQRPSTLNRNTLWKKAIPEKKVVEKLAVPQIVKITAEPT